MSQETAITLAACCTLGAVICIAVYHMSLQHTVRASSVKTWQIEVAVVASVLAIVAIVSSGGWREWLGAGAVLLSFMHAQVSARMAEKEAQRSKPDVDCYRWSNRYFAVREIAWFAYFATGRCWSALVGCVVFLAYPPWRKWWRNKYPLDFPCAKCGEPLACAEDCCSLIVVLPQEFGRVHEDCGMTDEERAAAKAAIGDDHYCDIMERVRDRVSREYDAARSKSESTAQPEEKSQ